MKCPNCGHRMQDNAAKLKARRHRQGLCIDCAAPLTRKERRVGNWRCFLCRHHVSVLRRRRQAAQKRVAA